ncbi:hypothetical protein EBB59_12815 [Lysobacter pythonis]|uniref:Uncharacterized protein n=2 Tax=Solilutibacter pythonis TaxID=2483112 RepID=A0A3M2HL02_9GAMM|nr:hypothetical protein EBB59_12815 [Lysobacter pythonis]
MMSMATCSPVSESVQPPAPDATHYGDGFPVIKPFDLPKAGSKVTADFELPNAMDGDHLRPVWVGFRFSIPITKDYAPGEQAASLKRTDYLYESPIPIRIRLWRIEGGERTPVVLHEMQQTIRPSKAWYEPHPDEVFTKHNGAGMDTKEMIAIGKFDYHNRAYDSWEVASIFPPTPGRYHIEMESLEDHPILANLPFEMVVTHYHLWGIKQ